MLKVELKLNSFKTNLHTIEAIFRMFESSRNKLYPSFGEEKAFCKPKGKNKQKSHIPLSNYMHIHWKSVYIEASSIQMFYLNSLLADHIACGVYQLQEKTAHAVYS